MYISLNSTLLHICLQQDNSEQKTRLLKQIRLNWRV